MDKAGAYAIQGLASKFVERIEGCDFNLSASTVENAIMDEINQILDEGGVISTDDPILVNVEGFEIEATATNLGDRIGISTYYLK